MSRIWSKALTWVDEQEHLDLVAMASMISIVVTAHHDPIFMVITAAVAVIVLSNRTVRLNPFTWIALGVGSFAWHLPTWFRFDNHVWLTAAWALGLGLCLLAQHPDRAAALEGRWLVAIIFGIGAMWKVGATDFRSGDYFQYAVINDDRFAALASWVGGIDRSALGPDRADLAALVATPGEPLILETTARLRAMAWVFTVWGVIIELAVALLWVLPLRAHHRWIRHVALLLFVGTTYLVVPVGGFGCLLMAIGLTQARGRPVLRRAYAGAFVALLAYGPIWRVLLGP